MAFNMDEYVEVPARIRQFHEDYPDGSLQCVSVEYRELPGAHLPKGEVGLHVIYHAAAYRTPDDPRPGHGMASEPLPGLTPYTKGSELMNAETSAWGRALVALGFVSKKVASANEVRARQDVPSNDVGPVFIGTEAHAKLIEGYQFSGVSPGDLKLKLAAIGAEAAQAKQGVKTALACVTVEQAKALTDWFSAKADEQTAEVAS